MGQFKLAAAIFTQAGFTLLELVLVMIIIGVLSATALPKFTATSDYQTKALFDDTLNTLRYAQKLSIASGCQVQVSLTSHGYALKLPVTESQCRAAAPVFSVAIQRPGSQTAFAINEPNLFISPSATFTFDTLGRASMDVVVNVNTIHSITVVKSTGFVYGS